MTEVKLPYLVQLSTQDDPPLSKVFQYLVELATPVVKSNLGDLFHDAMWMNKHIIGPDVWFYGVRETGTDIGTDYDLISRYNEKVWVVVLSKPKEWWTLTIGTPASPETVYARDEILKGRESWGTPASDKKMQPKDNG